MLIFNEHYQNEKNFIDKGNGTIIFYKNKKFIDLSGAAGTLLLGHNSKVFRDSLKKILNLKISNFSLPNKYALNFASSLKKIYPQFKKFIFCNTGAEANTKAIRLARALTGKDLIINVSGSWHGSIDQFLYVSNKKNKPIKISDGIGKQTKKDLVYIPYNNIKESLKILNRYKTKTCCVLIEPIQGCLPTQNSEKYLNFLNKYCKKNNLIFILDEVMSAVRINCSSVQNKLGIKSDISVFGKVLGGGLPIGIIGFTNKIYKIILKKKIKVYFGGTYSGNSISMFVGNETLKFILKNKNKIFSKLESVASKFEKEINKFTKYYNIDAKVIRYDSILRIIFTKSYAKNRYQRDFLEKGRLNNKIKFYNYLKSYGIYYPNNGIINIPYSIKKSELFYAINKIKAGLKKYFMCI